MRGGRQVELAHRHRDERHEKVDVHHEHQIDHRRDIELRRLGIGSARNELLGSSGAEIEARRMHGLHPA